MPALEFRSAFSHLYSPERANEVHRVAAAQTSFLNGLASASYASTGTATAGPSTRRCGCDDCEAATSPLAYLADLVAYINATVEVGEYGGGSSPLSLDALSDLLQQPLRDLVASCGAVTEPVHQVRLVIETLRRHLAAALPSEADVICSPFPLPLEHIVAGDVDGDRRDELVVAFRGSAASWLSLPRDVHAGYFVMDFDPIGGSWSHLRPASDAVGADFLLGPGLVTKKTICADVDGDGRDEVLIAVGNKDGSPRGALGRTWFWIMDYDPVQRRWDHVNPATFAQVGADLWLDDPSVAFRDLLAGDVDGDGEDEVVVSATSSALPNAFWVFDYVAALSGARAWGALSPGMDASLPSFELEQPTTGYGSYPPRLSVVRDIDGNGRDEIIAFPDAPGGLGANAWVMSYDPPIPAAPGLVGTWHHLNANPGTLNTDLPATWGWPARPAHAFAGATRGLNSSALLLAPEVAGVAPNASDPNSFFDVRYDATATPDPWTPADRIDCSTSGRSVSAAFAADVDGDLTDEIVAVIESGGRRAAWVMDRQTNGQWQHASPIAGHALEGDLEWTSRDYVFRGALGADIDLRAGGDLHTELVFYGTDVNSIWVMRFDTATKTWRHVSPALRSGIESEYLLAAYQALLAEVGTSLEELRAARGADEATRDALAERLGIVLRPDPTRPDTLERLLIPPDELSEARLEELFGLVDTTRDALSDGAVRGDGRGQVRRFELDDVTWSTNPWIANVGREGDLRLSLAKLPDQTIRIDVARPDGLGVAQGSGAATGRMRLTELSQSRLSGSVDLRYVQDTGSIELGVLPRLTAWRLERLRALWDDQDWPTSPFEVAPEPDEPVLPAVDPDVVGPDDFRVPFEKAGAADPDTAFDLWVARRTWLDGRLSQLRALQPNLAAMLDALRPPAGATPGDPDFPWRGAPPVADFAELAASITGGDVVTAAGARSRVRTKLWLPPDAFLRLVGLRRRLADVGQLADADWVEIRSILALALKRRRYEQWRTEEQAAGVEVDPMTFWRTARPPLEGVWPPDLRPNEPLVDPELLALADVPNGAAGTAARGLWRARRRELEQVTADVRAKRGSGLGAMLGVALGPPPTGTSWRARIVALASDLESTDPTVAATAQTRIASELGLDAGAFRRLAGLEAKLGASQQPTDAEWLDVEAILTSAHRRLVEHPVWITEEQALGALLPYWRVRGALLPRWRATPEHRLAWEAELRRMSRPPSVDPDRFPTTQLRSRAFNEPTSTVYTARRAWLSTRRQALEAVRQAAATPLEQIDGVLRAALFPSGESARLAAEIRRRRQARGVAPLLEEILGASAAEIAALSSDLASTTPATAMRAGVQAANRFWLAPAAFQQLAAIVAKSPAAVTPTEWTALERLLAEAALTGRVAGAQAIATRIGVRVRVLLEQLALRPAAHAQLLRTREVAVAGGPILPAEWDVVLAIVLRAEKQWRYGEWLREELGATPDRRIRLGPDSFVLAGPDDVFEPDEWLVTREEVRDWQSTLRSRTDQHANVGAGLRDAVSRVEERTLPSLRDALLQAIAPPGGDAAAWVSDHFLVDAKAGACDLTTRAAHAIDTSLALLWSLRTGQLRDTFAQLRLDAPSFDADWPIIGSYGAWRSAVLVRLYPENLYRPNLRRRTTRPFAEVMRELRSGRDLTSGRARALARRYADYFRDVATLDLGNVVCASARWSRSQGAPMRVHDFVFAASEASGKIYWCTVDTAAPPTEQDYAQSFWDEVPGLAAGDVTGLVGAAAYEPPSPTPQAPIPSWIYLFAVTQDLEGTSLVFVRFNLATRQWEDRVELQTPREQFAARVLADAPSNPPRVAFEYTQVDELGRSTRRFAVASMNKKGTGWSGEGVRELPQWQWTSFTGQLVRTPRELLAVDSDGDGLVELAAVPAGAAPIEFHRLTQSGLTAWGTTSRSVEAQSMVCTGDLDADRRMEVAWTLSPTAGNAGRSTAVLVEKRNLATGQWQPQSPDPARPDGASAAATNLQVPAKFIVCGDIDGVNGDEIILAIQEHFVATTVGETVEEVESWNAFWAIWRFGNGYRKTSPFTYFPDPELRNYYEFTSLGAAFRCAAVPQPAAFAVAGNFDGDGRDELVVFVSPRVNSSPSRGDNLSQGNDFWALDQRSADRRLRRFGTVQNTALGTVNDLETNNIVVARAIAADVDGDGRDELIAIPWLADDAVPKSVVWVADFRPGGAADPADGGYWSSLPDIDLRNESTAVTGAIGADLDGDGVDEVVLWGVGKTWVRKYDAARGTWDALPELALPANSTVAAAVAGKFRPGQAEQVVVSLGTVVAEETIGQPYNYQQDKEVFRRYRGTPSGREVIVLSLSSVAPGPYRPPCMHTALKPIIPGSPNAWTLDDTASVSERRDLSRAAWEANATAPASIRTVLWEAHYGLQVGVALQLQRAREFTSALDWFRLAYDYTAPLDERKTYYGLTAEESLADPGYEQSLLEWLRDPLDVHALVAIRPHAATRATILLICRCLLEAGNTEFTVDTSESIERARLLYETALDLMRLPILDQSYAGCSDVIGRVLGRFVEPEAGPVLGYIKGELARTLTLVSLERTLVAIAGAMSTSASLDDRLERASALAREAVASEPLPPTLAATVGATAPDEAHAELLATPGIAEAVARVGTSYVALSRARVNGEVAAARAGSSMPMPAVDGRLVAASSYASTATTANGTNGVPLWGFSTGTGVWFCVGPNPLLKALRLQAELNLEKIRTCRNITGMRRTLDFYSGATDQTTGLPMIGVNGELALPGARTARPTPYRYSALIERAKELARTAQQLEALLLAALERRDSEAYTLLQARQSALVARETVRLDELQVRQAQARVVRAELQQERAEVEQAHFIDLLDAGENEHELEVLDLLRETIENQRVAAALSVVSAISSAASSVAYSVGAYGPNAASAIGSSLGAQASAFSAMSGFAQTQAAISSTESQIASLRAGMARMRQDWRLRQRLAAQDILIAAQETRIEEESVRIAEQQRTISELDSDNAEQLLDFLHAKFTNVELYEWMIPIIERAYAAVLQHGAATGRLAAAQLAFERQGEAPPTPAADYWQPPAQEGLGADVTDRRGLTGAERLLQDLIELDQFAFETNRRKLQLTRTISLAQLAPLELERLRTSGIATFVTPSELFDRDFPGHYLRLIKRVGVSLIALVPPTEGIRATLSSSGISRVVVGPDVFQEIVVRREPQSIALTSPVNATGVFTFDTQPELANPFEFDAVNTTWELRMPIPSNPFDFRSIADLLLTIDYTAQESVDYRQQVTRQLGREFPGERAFSLRNDFPDAWWDMHNPDQSETPLAVTFDIVADDFPPTVADVAIDQVALVASSRGSPPRALTVRLRFAEDSGNGPPTSTPWLVAAPVDGIASTRRGNAGAWFALLGKRPIGRWWLSLPDTDEVREWLERDDLLDVLLVLTFRGETPPWPA
jgi:hypothetical protein